MSSIKTAIRRGGPVLLGWAALGAALYLSSLYSFLLFHSVAELFSIVIAAALFLIAWNTRRLTESGFFVFLGIAFFCAGLIDFVHTLAYKGMGIFPGYDADLPTKLWIIARYLQALSLLAAPLFLKVRLRPGPVLVGALAVTVFLVGAAFAGVLVPPCFVEGKGLTPFKIASEYVISAILVAALALLLLLRRRFDAHVLRLLVGSIICTVVAELAFTFYVSVYGLSNLIGHYFKIFAFYLLYRAVIVTGLEEPFRVLFFDLKEKRQELEMILDASPVIIFYKDSQNRYLRVNAAFAAALGRPKQEIEGKTGFDLFPSRDLDYWEEDREIIATGRPMKGVVRQMALPSGPRWFQVDKVPYLSGDGRILGVVGFAMDITERKAMEEEIRELSLRDELTGLYNRRGFAALAEQELKAAHRAGRRVLLVFLDMDGLKTINDTLGHEAGDEALREAADLLRRTFRSSDVISRLGGDEFAVLAGENPPEAEVLSNRLREALARWNQGERKNRLSFSWGLASSDPASPSSLEELLAVADRRMYAHKNGTTGAGA